MVSVLIHHACKPRSPKPWSFQRYITGTSNRVWRPLHYLFAALVYCERVAEATSDHCPLARICAYTGPLSIPFDGLLNKFCTA